MGLNADTAKTKLADIGQQAKEAARTAAQTGADELKNRVTPQSGSTGGSMAYNAAGAGGSMGSTGSTGGSLSGDTPGLSTTNPTPTL
jgi:hypothetical protein